MSNVRSPKGSFRRHEARLERTSHTDPPKDHGLRRRNRKTSPRVLLFLGSIHLQVRNLGKTPGLDSFPPIRYLTSHTRFDFTFRFRSPVSTTSVSRLCLKSGFRRLDFGPCHPPLFPVREILSRRTSRVHGLPSFWFLSECHVRPVPVVSPRFQVETT